MSRPIVTVIVPTKNSSATLEECLKSIKAQTYNPLELIVIDNFSDDDTPKIAKNYTPHFFQIGPERSTQRNFGVQQATGKYVMIIDSDMQLSPDVTEQCINTIESDQSLVGLVIPEESFGEGFWAQCKKFERSFYVGVSYMEAARFFNKHTFMRLGGYDETMISGEDWEFSQRVAETGKLGRINAYIYHNEGRISLLKTIRKKYYYAQKFAAYNEKTKGSAANTRQTSIVGRYKLFFSQPKKLLRHPVWAIGMLFMKTCEFGFGGAGYLRARS